MLNLCRQSTCKGVKDVFIQMVKGEYKTWTIYLEMEYCIEYALQKLSECTLKKKKES